MPSELIIGLEPFLSIAASATRIARPDLEVRIVPAVQGPDFVFDPTALDGLGPADGPAFIAIDHRYLGFKRLELAALVRSRGLVLGRVIGKHAVIGEGAQVSSTAFLGEGAIVGPGAVIGDHACIGARSVVGPRATIGPGVWLDPAVVIGASAEIGMQSAVGTGVIVAEHAEIGELCVLAVPGLVRGQVRSRTYFHPAFSTSIRIFG